MRVSDLIAVLQGVPGDAEVLIYRSLDDDGPEMTFKVAEAVTAYAERRAVEHQNFDITCFSNPANDTPIPTLVRTQRQGDGHACSKFQTLDTKRGGL